jgi:outer membrane lipase/esterase
LSYRQRRFGVRFRPRTIHDLLIGSAAQPGLLSRSNSQPQPDRVALRGWRFWGWGNGGMSAIGGRWTGAAIALATVVAGTPASGQSFNQFVGFGDSTIDSGWYRNAAPNSTNAVYNTDFAIAVTQGGGKATTNPGPVDSQLLAGSFGLTAIPANQPGGTNYATGDARNAQFNTGVPDSLQGAVPTIVQIGNYLAANNGIANPNALYLIGSGGNDISLAAGNLPTVVVAANALVAGIAQLAAAGARYIVVPDQPQSFGGATLEALRTTYDTTLWNGLAVAHVSFIPADINAMYLAVSSNPAAFGLIANAGPACTQPAGIPSGWAVFCSPTSTVSTLVAPNAEQTHLFADDEHLTTAGQKIVADYEYSLIVAPAEISFLAETPVKTREAMIEGMRAQIALSQRGRSVGSFNAWITGDLTGLALSSGQPGFPNDPGVPASATVGADYAFAPGWLVGAALAVGNTAQTFSLGGGFLQNEFAASAYAAFAGGPVWADVIASAGALDDTVNRVVPIGITTQANRLDRRHQLFAGRRERLFVLRRAVRPWAAGRHAAAAGAHQRLQRNRRLCRGRRLHRAVVRRTDPQLRRQRARLSGQRRRRHLVAIRQAGVGPRARLDQPSGHRLADHHRRTELFDAGRRARH